VLDVWKNGNSCLSHMFFGEAWQWFRLTFTSLLLFLDVANCMAVFQNICLQRLEVEAFENHRTFGHISCFCCLLLAALQAKLNEEKSARQKADLQSQEKERQMSMLSVDYRQIQQRLQKLEGEHRQENEKVWAFYILAFHWYFGMWSLLM